MKIVIEIDEEDWKDINYIHFIREDLKFKIGKAIMKGKPLPEHHGRLIDISEYEKYFNTAIIYDDGNHKHVVYTNTIPTIIEGSEEDADSD